uniref:Disease resistance R13L4/SHOC-2-like LRR domain-containing protein n=1 Tax=Physcomitrium patens TaxID=3218 RepID=A0A2K1JUL5_PHYPA|nr:hypothetical protein PHYPA_015003 [Physcomitrium patens]
MTKKRVIVFDNVINQSQIEDVVPIDDLFAISGTTLIYCGIELCKVNIQELDEKTSLRLFITHSYRHLAKKIVKACNGLSLSLKVMDAYLRDKKRLKRERQLDRDENNSDHKIWDILRVSFDNLRVEEKRMFLEICYFFSNNTISQGMYLSLISLLNELGDLTSLTILDMMDCYSLTSLSNELGNLSSLTTLNIEWYKSLMSLHNELGNLTYLSTLNIRRCSSLMSLPNKLGNLTSLTTLDIMESYNLISLPNKLHKLTSLTTFDLYRCKSTTGFSNFMYYLRCIDILC